MKKNILPNKKDFINNLSKIVSGGDLFRRGGQEWLKAHAWKACKRETVSREDLINDYYTPLSPPLSTYTYKVFKKNTDHLI